MNTNGRFFLDTLYYSGMPLASNYPWKKIGVKVKLWGLYLQLLPLYGLHLFYEALKVWLLTLDCRIKILFIRYYPKMELDKKPLQCFFFMDVNTKLQRNGNVTI